MAAPIQGNLAHQETTPQSLTTFVSGSELQSLQIPGDVCRSTRRSTKWQNLNASMVRSCEQCKAELR